MNLIKLASAKLTKKMLSGPYGNFNAYVIIGDIPSDTYNIKDSLARLGFKWFGAQKLWYLTENKMTPYIQQQLQNIRVITENQLMQSTQPTQLTQPIATEQSTLVQSVQPPTIPQKPTTKQYVTEDEDMTKWYKFPINKNIETYDQEFEIDGEKHTEKITIDRLYVPGKDSNEYNVKKSREYIGFPYYIFNIGEKTAKKKYSEEIEQVPEAQLKFISKEKYGTYNEEEHLAKLKETVKQIIENNPPRNTSSTARNELRWKYDLVKRTPELNELLMSIENKTYQSNFKLIITNAENPEYNGEYPVNFITYAYKGPAKDLYINTALNTPGAASSKILSNPKLFKIYTVEDFNNLIENTLKQDNVVQAYIDYLSSFPFLQSQKESEMNSFQEIQSMLSNPESIPSQTIMKKLQALGYIRPSKRQKQFEGISSGEEIKWIVDSKKIVNDIYSNRFLQNSTDFFYAVVAYYIHRQIKNIWSWSDSMLMDSISTWIRNMKKLGANLDYKEIVKSIEYIGQYIQ